MQQPSGPQEEGGEGGGGGGSGGGGGVDAVQQQVMLQVGGWVGGPVCLTMFCTARQTSCWWQLYVNSQLYHMGSARYTALPCPRCVLLRRCLGP
jgi:hypothetical protein